MADNGKGPVSYTHLDVYKRQILKDQITTIFVQIDDFCKEFDLQIKNLKLNAAADNKKRRNRSCLMSDSEIITIMIGFHLGAHKTFKHYYKEIVCGYWKDLFPKSLSYNRFVELQQRSFAVSYTHLDVYKRQVLN